MHIRLSAAVKAEPAETAIKMADELTKQELLEVSRTNQGIISRQLMEVNKEYMTTMKKVAYHEELRAHHDEQKDIYQQAADVMMEESKWISRKLSLSWPMIWPAY